jgi:3-oxoacyl-[acyl-carrier protein] reductase
MTEQKQRIVVVTGGSRGIGRAICIALAAPDSSIYFNYFSPNDPDAEAAAAAETEKLVAQAQGSATSKSVNIAKENEVVNFFKEIIDKTKRIDVLVNNAGITKDGLLVRMKEQDWDAVLDINLKGAFTCTKIVSKVMMQQRYGRIINMASVVGVTGNDKNSCQRTCPPWYYGQCNCTGFYRNRHDGGAVGKSKECNAESGPPGTCGATRRYCGNGCFSGF